MERIRSNQAGKGFGAYVPPERLYPEEPEAVHRPVNVTELAVALPKCYFGFKEKKPAAGGAALARQEAATRIMLDLVLGPGSELYQALYDENLISDTFGFDCQMTDRYAFSMIGGDTRDPERLIERVKEGVRKIARNGFDEADFERQRRKRIGHFLRMFNSPEAVAHEYTKHRFRGIDPFGWLDVYESLTLADVRARFEEHVNWDRLAVSIVRSGENR